MAPPKRFSRPDKTILLQKENVWNLDRYWQPARLQPPPQPVAAIGMETQYSQYLVQYEQYLLALQHMKAVYLRTQRRDGSGVVFSHTLKNQRPLLKGEVRYRFGTATSHYKEDTTPGTSRASTPSSLSTAPPASAASYDTVRMRQRIVPSVAVRLEHLGGLVGDNGSSFAPLEDSHTIVNLEPHGFLSLPPAPEKVRVSKDEVRVLDDARRNWVAPSQVLCDALTRELNSEETVTVLAGAVPQLPRRAEAHATKEPIRSAEPAPPMGGNAERPLDDTPQSSTKKKARKPKKKVAPSSSVPRVEELRAAVEVAQLQKTLSKLKSGVKRTSPLPRKKGPSRLKRLERRKAARETKASS